MKKVHALRLLKLADYLETVPRKQFDFQVWGEERDCGTVACALGHACMMPSFRRLGARLGKSANDDGMLVPMIGSASGSYHTAEELFGLNGDQVDTLFLPGEKSSGYSGLSSGATPKQVARHIRKFVKECTAQ